MDLLKHFSPFVQWHKNGFFNEEELIRNNDHYERLMLTQYGTLFVGFNNPLPDEDPFVYEYDMGKKEWKKKQPYQWHEYEYVFDPLNLTKESMDWLFNEIEHFKPYCDGRKSVSESYYQALLVIKDIVDGKYTAEEEIRKMRVKQRLDGI